MAPRKLSQQVDDDAASITSGIETLKPNTKGAKVEKKKSAPKPRAPKKEKAEIIDDDDLDAGSVTSDAVNPDTTKTKTEKKRATPRPRALNKGKAEGEEAAPKAKAVKKEKIDGAIEKSKAAKKETTSKDGKEKIKAVTGDEAVSLIVQYLKEQNRPYSATEVSANLHGKVTKTVADKLLKDMAEMGVIVGKASGKQWVFWTIQDSTDVATPEELTTMDTTINALRETNPVLKSTLKTLTHRLNTLLSAPTTSELVNLIARLQEDNKTKRDRVHSFKEGIVKMVTREEVNRVEKENTYWIKKRKARKDAFINLEAVLLEGMSKDDIWEGAGIEEDCYI